MPWSPKEAPWDFGQDLLAPDLDRIAPSLEIGFRHFPAVENAGIKRVINGPFTFAPDGNPLVGPVQGLTNFWSACAVMAGFSQGGGVGLALSNWMVHGDPGYDIFAMDVARFGEWTTLRYTNAKVRENYSKRFSIRFPNEELPAARPHQTTPLYDIMVRDNNAVMGDTWGLETPLWFAPEGTEPVDILSFHRSNDFEHVGNEVRAVRTGVGVTEIANFAKYQITGPGAEAWLSHLMTNTMPKQGRICLTPMLDEKGKLIGDFHDRQGRRRPLRDLRLIGRSDLSHALVRGSSAGRWLRPHSSLRTNPGRPFDSRTEAAGTCWPSWSTKTSRRKRSASWTFREMSVAGAPCMVNRITYTGDLGYEIWMEPTYERLVYSALKEAGEERGIIDFGMRALLSMRLEKNFPTWFAELRPIYGPFEGSMERFIKLSKNNFIGREAAAREHADGPKLKRVSFIIDAEDADVMADEPVWAKVGDTDHGTVVEPHGYGAPRFDADGKEISLPRNSSIRDGAWRVVGWVTSGGYGHFVQHSLAQAYVPAALAERDGSGLFEIEILGIRRPARITVEPPFDPAGEKMRS